eukprot:CAMPEP_0182561758 /NCGR_PEP_ID=MMETSP1324-20130603/4180_1 /TAXON_ID=236786 /ORGANISM="Florenciella sp., Strain RCC1587" /LENGTH=108 /DNA_ID=CAMNT_0024774469 /DNA_START=393 /DNA_END=717 /DNA_ORIENTATION=+
MYSIASPPAIRRRRRSPRHSLSSLRPPAEGPRAWRTCSSSRASFPTEAGTLEDDGLPRVLGKHNSDSWLGAAARVGALVLQAGPEVPHHPRAALTPRDTVVQVWRTQA